MRNAFAEELTALAAEDERVVMLSGDIGNRLFDGFKERFPQRFYNCGVAEANMIGVAAGLAMNGLRPIAYTIASFTTFRCYEQIRVDACYQNLPVVVAGVGAGMSYAANGGTHHSCEDVAVLRALPNMKVVCPGDPTEVRLALRAALREAGPVYLRMGKKGEPVVHQTTPAFEIGKGIVVRPGTSICLLATGTVLPVACEAADALAERGVPAQVVSFHTVKPLDEQLLAEAFANFAIVATIEEHSVVGGLGGAVAEWASRAPRRTAQLLTFGTPDEFLYEAGDQEYARRRFGLTPRHIADVTLQALPRHGLRRSA